MAIAIVPLMKAVIFAALGFALGGGLAKLLTSLVGVSESTEPVIALGYIFAFVGWILGIGVWDSWAREWFSLPLKHKNVQGWQRYLHFNTDHKVIGVQYLVTFMALFLLAGLLAVLMRMELIAPGRTIMGPKEFNNTMSLHGIIMVAVAVATIMGGLANFALPLLIGAEDVAFPRLNALSYWIVPPVALLLIASIFFGGFDSGWTAYPPLSVTNATGQLFFLLAFITFGFSSILGGLNFIATVITMRAPGMTWGRLPIFVWSILAAAIISLTATQFVAMALISVVLDRVVGTSFYDASNGGKPLLYQHLFWFYSHPAVYIMILPGFGVALEVLAHFSRKPLFAYKWVVGSFLSIVALSFLVWAHHLYTSGMPDALHIPFMVTTELISVPTGLIFLSALGTIWIGRLWLTTPMLFALGFIFNFLIGGITGVFLADVPTDIHLQDTYFVVAHFHYTIMGGEVFAIFAGIYYWFPKITGRMFDQRLGNLHFWWMFVGYNATFLSMFWVGLQGMNRRVADYPAPLAGGNVIVSISAFILAASFLVFVFNMVHSWVKGARSNDNPWHARTLEWQTSSPPPLENFDGPTEVLGHPYGYGTPGSVHATVGTHAVIPTNGAIQQPLGVSGGS